MQCLSPPELNDSQLLAYLDGVADAAVETHLASCRSCRQRAQQLARLLGRMTVWLYRLECPASTDLGEYQLGLLPQPQLAGITAHLAECLHCRAEVAQLQGYLADTARDEEPGIVERARVLLARLLSSSPPAPALAPALAGIRGGGDTLLVYEAGDVQVTLTIEVSQQQPEQRTLFGLVIGAEQAAQVQLWLGTQLVSEATIDTGGNFVIAGLAAASYQLIISGPGLEVYIQDMQV